MFRLIRRVGLPAVIGMACLAWPGGAAAGCPPMQICHPPIFEDVGGTTPGFTANMDPNGITGGPNGTVWFTESNDPGAIVKITRNCSPVCHYPVTEFVAGTTPGFTAGAGPDQITAGPDGDIWFTEPTRGSLACTSGGSVVTCGGVARFDPTTSTVTEIVGGTDGLSAGATPTGITTGPDGHIWFTETTLGLAKGDCAASGHAISCGGLARVNSDGTVTEFEGGHVQGLKADASPQDITAGPAQSLWFTEPNLQKSGPCGGVGRFSPSTDTGSQFFACTLTPFYPRTGPWGISPDGSGHVWFAAQGDGCGGCLSGPGGVGYVSAGSVVNFPSNSTTGFTADSTPTGIALGADMSMWFTEASNPGALARVNPDGSVTELIGGSSSPDSGLTANGQPNGIAPGIFGNVWFTESANPGRVGFVSLQALSVSGVSPNGGPAAGGNVVTITGPGVGLGNEGGFLPGEQVKFGSTLSPTVTYVSATELQAVAPAENAGAVDVTVGSVSGWSKRTSADLYAYGPPVVTKVSPNAGATAGTNTITIIGHGFVPGTTVSFGSTPSSAVTFVSKTQITAVVPAGAAGVVDVGVSTPGGSSPTSSADLYAYGAPSVSGLAPTSGSTAGGNTVVITGAGFVPGTRVTFGPSLSSSVTFDSPTEIEAVAPPEPAGTIQVRAHTAAGASPATSADSYMYAG